MEVAVTKHNIKEARQVWGEEIEARHLSGIMFCRCMCLHMRVYRSGPNYFDDTKIR